MAGSSSRADDGKKKARIEIIPLIDVIFFLLATFVLFTLSLARIASVPVTLPKVTGIPTPPDPELVTLQISDQGTCYWNRDLIQIEDLAPKLADLKNRIAKPRVLITGDDKAKFGATVRALDEVRKAGITEVAVETRVRAPGK